MARYGPSLMRARRNIFAGSIGRMCLWGRFSKNILDAARIRPVVIQSLWFRLKAQRAAAEEVECLLRSVECDPFGGGRLKDLQLYTIARDPGRSFRFSAVE